MPNKHAPWLTLLRYFFRDYQRAYALLIGTSVLGGVLEGASLAMLVPFLERLIGAETTAEWLTGPGRGLLAAFTQRWPQLDPLVVACAALLAVYLARQVVMILNDFVIADTSARVMHDARRNIYCKYAAAPYAYFLDHKVGELTYNSTIPSKSLAVALVTGPRFIVELCRVTGVLVLLALVSPGLTALLGLLGVALYLPITHLMGRRVYRTGVATRNLNTRLTAELTEFYSGIKQVMVKGLLPVWLARIHAVNEAFRRAYRRETLMPSLPAHVFETLAVVGVLGFMMVMQLGRPAQLRQSLPMVGLFGIGLLRMMPSFMMLGKHWLIFTTCLPDVERMHGLLTAGVPQAHRGTMPAPPVTRGIVFERVGFAYGNGRRVFSELSVEFPRGVFCVVTGLSGAGKTTLMSLVLGLYEPTEGRILIDGVPLSTIERASWYRRIGYVSQDVFLFHGTVAENIGMFDPALDAGRIEAAARLAHAHEFITRLPEGYDTVVGERGLRLSGGQQQRLALARAIVHQPDVILLDEATTALDAESERLVRRAIAEIAAGRTVIAIAHRPATVQQAQRIYVIEEGQLVADGSHEDLMARSTHYRVLQD